MKKTLFVLSVALISAFGSLGAAEWYVAPNGSPNGNGSKQSPWDLKTALVQTGVVRAGDTVWLRGGRYGTGGATMFTATLSGSSTAPVIVRGYPGEDATVDGGITCNNGHVWFWGFEIMNSSTGRKVQNAERPPGLTLLGVGDKAINMVIHDTGHPGIGFWNNVGDGGEVYGTIIYNNGLYDLSDPRFPDGWTRGSAIYTQNKDGTRYIMETIAFRNFTTGINAYTENSWTDGYHTEGNVSFDHPQWNLWYTGGNVNPMQRLKVINNYTYIRRNINVVALGLGYSDRAEGDVVIKDNYLVAGSGQVANVNRWADVKMTGNTFIGAGNLVTWQFSTAPAANVNSNNYFGSATTGLFNRNGTSYNFPGWKTATGYDANSTFTPSFPTETKIFVRPNRYEAGRSHVIVYNWGRQATAQVDLSRSGLSTGTSFEIRDAQNLGGTPVYTGVYDGNPVTVPLNLTEFAPMIGPVTHFTTTNHTPSEFNVFLVLPTANAVGNTAPTISTIAAQSTKEGTSTPAITFTVSDAQTAAADLVVTAESSNQSLVPNNNIVLGGSGVNRWITVSPAANQIGTSTITVRVDDGNLQSFRQFVLTVVDANLPPSITAIPNQVTTVNSVVGPLTFTVSDPETAAGGLAVTASSSNTQLVPTSGLVVGGTGGSRSLTVSPALNQVGTANITVRVSDGTNAATRTFSLTVNPQNNPPTVSAGQDQLLPLNREASLAGTATDDGLPGTGALNVTWTVVDGPGAVLFANDHSLSTTARFTLEGIYRLRLTASDGVLAGSSEVMVLILPPETSGPQVSDIQSRYVSSTNATITWHTSVPTDSQVQYGPTAAYDRATPIKPTLTTTHTNVLVGLTPNTTYHFRVLAKDSAGNLAVSGDLTFTTMTVPRKYDFYIPVSANQASLALPMILGLDPLGVVGLDNFITSPVYGAGTASFTFDVPEAGEYVVWGRVQADSYLSDSFYVSLDNGPEDVYDVAEGTWQADWQWTVLNGRAGGEPETLNPRVLTLTAGQHTLVFRTRDANSKLSKLLVTNDRQFVPADDAPVSGVATAKTLDKHVIRMLLPPGYSTIANQLTKGANTIAEVLPNTLEGARVFAYDSDRRSYIGNNFTGGRWSNGSQQLKPGVGVFFFNPSTTPAALVLSGDIPVNQAPWILKPGLNLVSLQQPRTTPLGDLSNLPLEVGDVLYRFDGLAGGYIIHYYFGAGQWSSEPIIRVGEAFFIEHYPAAGAPGQGASEGVEYNAAVEGVEYNATSEGIATEGVEFNAARQESFEFNVAPGE